MQTGEAIVSHRSTMIEAMTVFGVECCDRRVEKRNLSMENPRRKYGVDDMALRAGG